MRTIIRRNMGEIHQDRRQGSPVARDTGRFFYRYYGAKEMFRFPRIPGETLLEYAGAGLGIAGWLGVRQIGSTSAQQVGFLIWMLSGFLLVAWGYSRRAKGIVIINTVNTLMAGSAFIALLR